MAMRHDVDEIQKLTNRDIFLDTNIWIYLFGSFSDSQKHIVKKYSRAFKYLIQSNNKLYTDITVISEFINRYQRHKFYIYKINNNIKKTFDFKRDYKKTSDFYDHLKLVSSIVKNKIMKWASTTNPNYENKDIDELIDNIESREIDFNDLHIEKLCQMRKFILLTHDGDFIDSSIDIISGNQKLLTVQN